MKKKTFVDIINKIKEEKGYKTDGEALELFLSQLDGLAGDWRVEDFDFMIARSGWLEER